MKNLKFNFFLSRLLVLLSSSIKSVDIFKEDITLNIKKSDISKVTFFLKKHSNLRFESLMDLTCIDYPGRLKRFEVLYNFLSFLLNKRIFLKVFTNSTPPVSSLSLNFKSAFWLEREVWDMFGIIFSNHLDLRRILTDYGFEGFPLRKDFPLTGFVETRFDEEEKTMVYEPLSLSQEYRSFSFRSPWYLEA